jgi:hypothetical protein
MNANGFLFKNRLYGLQKSLTGIYNPDFGIYEYCKGPIGDEY